MAHDLCCISSFLYFCYLWLAFIAWRLRVMYLNRRAIEARQQELETMATRPLATVTLLNCGDNSEIINGQYYEKNIVCAAEFSSAMLRMTDTHHK